MYQSNKVVHTKQGDNNLIPCWFVDDDDKPIDISNMQITSHIKDINHRPIGEMTIQLDDAPNGAFFMAIPTDVYWGNYFADVRFVENGIVRHSDIFRLTIHEVVTCQN